MLGTNIGIDLGTTTIRIFVEGKGIVVSEPSAVAFDTDTGRLLAVGQKASDMIGRNPDSITVVKPMRSELSRISPPQRPLFASCSIRSAKTWCLSPT